MPNDLAISVWVKFLSISSFFISILFMAISVQKFFTFVKRYFEMKQAEAYLKDKFSRQIKKFLMEEIDGMINEKGNFRTTEIAEMMNKYYKVTDIKKQNVEGWLDSPQTQFIVWLLDECHMNLKWVLHGEEDKKIKAIKIL